MNASSVSAASADGDVNVGCAAAASDSVTRGPSSVCVHAWVSVSSASGSVLALPSSVTSTPSRTMCGVADAFATGASLTFVSVTSRSTVAVCAPAVVATVTA